MTSLLPNGWHYGPTPTDPDPGKMWHYVCGGEVLSLDGGYVCACGQQWDGTTFAAIPGTARPLSVLDFVKIRLREDEYITKTTWIGGFDPQVWRALEDRERRDLEDDETFTEIHAYERGYGDAPGTEKDYGEIVGWINNGRRAEQHVARWDPDRVLRGVEAKRKLIDTVMAWEHQSLYSGYDENVGPFPCTRDGAECDPVMCGVAEKQDQVLRALAAEHADHPDCRTEWKP